jgi:hypothetical protein
MADDLASGRVTNAVLANKLDTVIGQIEALCVTQSRDHDQVTINTGRLTMMENAFSKPTILCPQHSTVTQDIVMLRIEMAKMAVGSGVAGGGTVALVAGVVFGVGKAAGWW